MTAPQPAVVVLAGGHESDGGRDLAGLVTPSGAPAGRGPVVHAAAAAGRPLAEAVRSALAAGDGPVCVVPMTLGRDPKLVADTARALRWLAVLWKQRHDRAARFAAQHARVRLLQRLDNPWRG